MKVLEFHCIRVSINVVFYSNKDSEIIREAKLLKQLKNNPYLIEYEDCFFDETGDFFYIITEFCQVIIIICIYS